MGWKEGLDGSLKSSLRWTEEQRAEVDNAIASVANRKLHFTTDDVWSELGEEFPVTKGMTARLVVAKNNGMIVQTDEMTIAERGGKHDHAQRLTVWKSLVYSQRNGVVEF